MNIDDLTLKEIKHIQSLLKHSDTEGHPYQIGKNYFIRTVTHHITGKLLKVTDKELLLGEAAWIADDGRFNEALKTGNLNEVEPFPDEVIVGRGSLIDACIWNFALPREVK